MWEERCVGVGRMQEARVQTEGWPCVRSGDTIVLQVCTRESGAFPNVREVVHV